jgi:hypothetical protein
VLAQLHVSKTRLPAVPDVVSLRDAGTDSARMEKGGVDRGKRDQVFEKSKGERSGSMRMECDAKGTLSKME